MPKRYKDLNDRQKGQIDTLLAIRNNAVKMIERRQDGQKWVDAADRRIKGILDQA